MTTRIAMLSIESSDQASPRRVQLVGNQRFGNQHVSCPAGQFGSIAANTYTADTQEAADSLAAANLQCHYENAEQTATCPEGETGDPVTIPAGTYSSLVSQEDADAQAAAAAEAALVCVVDETSEETTFAPIFSDAVFTIVDSVDSIFVGGSFQLANSVTRRGVCKLNFDGSLVTGFDAGLSIGAQVRAVLPLEDGKILIGGSFSTVHGTARGNIARLNADGSLDSSFANPSANSTVFQIGLQQDGSLIVTGNFTSLGGSAIGRVGKIAPDGTVDVSFNPNANNPSGQGVTALAVTEDDDFFIGGTFTSVSSVTRNGIARISSGGVLVSGYNPNASDLVRALCLNQSSNALVVGGEFTTIAGVSNTRLARLDDTGANDGAFVCALDARPIVITEQPDGAYVLSGNFTTVNGNACAGLARISHAGAWDSSIVANTAGGFIFCHMVRSTGYIYFGGTFASVNGQARISVGRLSPTGDLT